MKTNLPTETHEALNLPTDVQIADRVAIHRH